ncbi:cell division control protein 14, SIN component-domain-containing protein [Flagelloscypha sp. PMI_526]|nr:cell division control protein 14, SIN component-domain-containing protein [Flagelloscypha sp. PMI_526]
MDERTAELSNRIQSSLDDLMSPRTSESTKLEALKSLEHELALSCMADNKDFLALQFTFECNVPSRLLNSIAVSTIHLDGIVSKLDRITECETIASRLALSLFLMQGLVLNHPSSKSFVGRRASLEILLDLLLTSRHLTTPSSTSSPSLSSTIIDTLLCILVDNSAGLRAFEDVNGLQAIVKILKRAGTPREVRMKCLEFLYFYLLEESPIQTVMPASSTTTPVVITAPSTPTPSSPTKPRIRTKPGLVPTPRKPSPNQSVYGSSTFSFPSSKLSLGSGAASASSSRSTSSSSSTSNTSTTSSTGGTGGSGSETDITTPPSSPTKLASRSRSTSPVKRTSTRPPVFIPPSTPKPKSLIMLKKDLDFVPSTPPLRKARTEPVIGSSDSSRADIRGGSERGPRRSGHGSTRSIDEKKEILGTMLGNVDALVEGVRKAGIWGLKG